jgi:hypothetical protein
MRYWITLIAFQAKIDIGFISTLLNYYSKGTIKDTRATLSNPMPLPRNSVLLALVAVKL